MVNGASTREATQFWVFFGIKLFFKRFVWFFAVEAGVLSGDPPRG
jgi:hypothetical protein